MLILGYLVAIAYVAWAEWSRRQFKKFANDDKVFFLWLIALTAPLAVAVQALLWSVP